MSQVKVLLNGREIEARSGQTILKVAQENGVSIPTFCYHPALKIVASCRMCLVEVAGAPKLLPACQTEVRDGMKIYTESEKVKDWQKRNLEFILLHHPIDCPICDAAGDCKLQNFYEKYDSEKSRLWSFREKLKKSKHKILGPNVIYDGERCILCTLCIRFCEQIWGEHLLDSRLRGNKREIIVAEGQQLDFPYSLMTVELCPVGAMTNRHFRFKKRCWFLSSLPGICPGCAAGCATVVDHDEGIIYRTRPRFDPEVNNYWLCDDGVLIGKLHNSDRISTPLIKKNGKQVTATIAEASNIACSVLQKSKPEKIAIILSSQNTCEENVAMMLFAHAIGITGPVFVEGKPKGEGDNLLRCEDKNPNTKGAISAAGNRLFNNEGKRNQLIELINSGKIETILCLGSEGPSNEELRGRVNMIVIAPRYSNTVEVADVVFPAPSYAETSGTYINNKGMPRKFNISIKSWGSLNPPSQVFETLNIISETYGRPGAVTKEKIESEVKKIIGGGQ